MTELFELVAEVPPVQELAVVGGGAASGAPIDDDLVSPFATWSSRKIDSEIQAVRPDAFHIHSLRKDAEPFSHVDIVPSDILPGYEGDFRIRIHGLQPVNNGVTVLARCRLKGAAAPLSGADYHYAYIRPTSDQSNATGASGPGGYSSFPLLDGVRNLPDSLMNGWLDLTQPLLAGGSAEVRWSCGGGVGTGTLHRGQKGWGRLLAGGTPVDAIRIFATSGQLQFIAYSVWGLNR